MVFKTLSAIDCSAQIEKKGSLSYLSWTWAWGILMQHYPASTFEFHDDAILPDGSVMVSCTVTVEGTPRRMWLPVMDHKNNAIKQPDARKISDARMRCLVKAIALHGLGLYIYAGEDMPASSEPKKAAGASALETSKIEYDAMSEDQRLFLLETSKEVSEQFAAFGEVAAFDLYESKRLDNDERYAIWHLFDSKLRASLKRIASERSQA